MKTNVSQNGVLPQPVVNYTELAAQLEASNQAAQEALTQAQNITELQPKALADEQEPPKRSSASSITNTVTHCRVFIALCMAYGNRYLSSNARYSLNNLRTMADTASDMLVEVDTTQTTYKYAVAHRLAEFEGLDPLCALIVAEMILSGSPEETINQVRTIVRSLRGERKVPKNPNDPMQVYKSVSQRNYDDVTANFARLIMMVAGDANYNPAAEELKLVSLEAKLESLRTANSDVETAKAALEAARIVRNEYFDTPATGLVDTFITAKNVVLTNFGRRSEQYKKVKGLTFRKIRGK